MRFSIAIAVAMIASGAHAQNCQVVGSQTLCDSSLLGRNSGNVQYWSGNSNGSGAYSNDGTTYQRLGDSKLFSNGVTSQSYGDTTYFSDGRICQKFANQIFCN
jgi:hypothetical protein